MNLCRHLRALSKSQVSLNTCRLYCPVLIPCNGEYELSVGDQGELSCCHLTAGCSPELFFEPFLQEQCHPHLRDNAGENIKSYHGLKISHDLVQTGSLHFFACSWGMTGTAEGERRELEEKGKSSTDCNKLTHKCLCVFEVCLIAMCE